MNNKLFVGQARSRRLSRLLGLLLLVPGGLALIPAPLGAIGIGMGRLRGSFDTTISWGTTYRLEKRDNSIIGVSNGGNAYSINGDDGNLNFDAGDFVSNSLNVTHELLLQVERWSFFGRAFYFNDFQIMSWTDSPRIPLTNELKNRIGRDFVLLDAYVSADFALGSALWTLQAGNQVLNWGESTFIQNGLNSMSTVDAAKLRIAGAELRSALRAVPMVSTSLNFSQRFTVDAFVPFLWDHTEIEPAGSMFSTNDFASPGGKIVYLGFGSPAIVDTGPNTGVGAPVGVEVFRAADRDARDGGEFGVALRWFEPRLRDTEFGFYFTRLHSRLPLISGYTGLLQEGLGAGNYAATANYFRVFPEDIDTYGFSWNTELPRVPVVMPRGMAWQGEVSYRRDQPLQVDDVELLFAALSPIDEFIGFGAPNQGFKNSQLTNGVPFGFNEEVPGWRRKDVLQAQMTLTQLLGPHLGADQWVLLGEAGITQVFDMESKDVLRYEGPGTYTSGNPYFTQTMTASGNPIQPVTETGGFADEFSWGYRAVLRAELNSFIGPVNVQPSVVWYHDVKGTSPSPILNFIEGRKSLTVGLSADYLLSWSARLFYTSSFGGGRYNLLRDRDFLTFSLGYSF